MGPSSEGSRLEAGAEDFRLLVEQAAVGIFISTAEGEFVSVNSAGHRLLGYGPRELVGKQIHQVLPPGEQSHLAEALAHVLGGEVLTHEWTFLRKDGSFLRAEVTAQRLSSGFLMAIVHDIAQREAFERKIRESEARVRSILETAPDVIMTVDRKGTILFINRTTVPFTLEQVIGTCCLDYVPPDARPRVEAALETVFSTREIDEYEVLGPPGSTGRREWSSVRVGPLIDGDRVVAATLCATNVTRRREADQAKARLEDQLRQAQKMQSIGQLAGGVAHDFNNLLTSILGFIELAQIDLPKDSDAAGLLDGAVQSVKRGAALSQQLLAFARKKLVRPELVTLNDVLRETTTMMRRLLGENLELVLSLAPDLGAVRVDVGSMEQVIMNLVINARDAISGPGRIILETQNVVLDAEYCRDHADIAPGEYVMLCVSDTGAGMTAETAARVFEPFFTTKPVGEGTGLGLAMCEGTVRQAGGAITVSSELGKGSSFRVYLPRTRELRAPTRTKPLPRTTVGGHETLLVVEDEQLILSLVTRALTALGYNVMTAADGAQALQIVTESAQPIHLLITDVVMPTIGGRELAARLATLRPNLRVLYTSGYAPNATQDGALEVGINFLQKPYTPTDLATRIREVLDRR